MLPIEALTGPEKILETVQRLGFLPFFKNGIPGFSIAEHTPPRLWFSDTEEGPWEWKGPLARTGDCVYSPKSRSPSRGTLRFSGTPSSEPFLPS